MDANAKPAWQEKHPDFTVLHRFVFKHGRGATCTRKAWVVEMTIAEYQAAQYAAPCPVCGRKREGRRITGRRNDAIKCNARCQAATGHDCECSCSGKNHGAAHAA